MSCASAPPVQRRAALEREQSKEGKSAHGLAHSGKSSIDEFLWYLDDNLEHGDLKEGPLSEDGRLLYNLLHSLPSSRGSVQDRLIARYRLILARDLIGKNPSLMKELESSIDDFHSDSLARDPRFADEEAAHFRHFLQALMNDDLEVADLVKRGQEAGLDITFPEGERVLHGIAVDGEEFLIFRADAEEEGQFKLAAVFGKPPGVGKNHWQRAPISEVLTTVSRMSELEELLQPREATEGLSLIHMGPNTERVLEEEAPAFLQLRDMLQSHGESYLADHLYGLGEDLLSFDEKTKHCKARLETLESLGRYADLGHISGLALRELEDLDEESPDLSERDREYIKKAKQEAFRIKELLGDDKYLSGQIDASLSEARKTANRYLDPRSQGRVLPSAYMRFQNFSDAVDSLDRSRNLNAAAIWAYLSQTHESEDPDVWRRKILQEMALNSADRRPSDGSGLASQSRLIYGGLLVEQDPHLKRELEQSYEEEADLRLQARLLGRIPEKELIYMPSPDWVGARGSPAGQHHASDKERPSFVFLSGTRDKAWRENVIVHELIHAGQRTDARSLSAKTIREQGVSGKDAATVMRSLDEALTETLTQVRMNSGFAKQTNARNIPRAAYPEHVAVLLQVLDRMRVPQEARETVLEELAVMSGEERIRAIDKMLDRQPGISVVNFWKSLLVLQIDGDLDRLGSYFRSG